jgi:hypothetical protein
MSDNTAACRAIADRGLIERYVAGRLEEDDDLALLETHLLTCDDCREEVRLATAVRAEVATLGAHSQTKVSPLRGRGPWWVIGTAAAAAGVVLLLGRNAIQPRSEGPVTRGHAAAEGVPEVATVEPAPGSMLGRAGLTFVWRSAGQEVEYKVTVTNEPGDVVWRGAGLDTVQHLPQSVRLSAGQSYSWYVDALLPDGRSAISKVQRFTVAR